MDKLQSSVLIAMTLACMLILLMVSIALLVGCATVRPHAVGTYSALGDWCEGRGLGSPAWCAVSAQASAWRTADQTLSVLNAAAQVSGMAAGLVAWPMSAVSVGLGALGDVGQSAQAWCAAHPDHAGVWARIRCGAPAGEASCDQPSPACPPCEWARLGVPCRRLSPGATP